MSKPDAGGMAPAVYRVIRGRYPFAPEILKPEMGFGVDLAGDSLTFIELVGDVEVQLGVRLQDEEAAAVRTIGELVALVTREAKA